jgi:hypothetical protein
MTVNIFSDLFAFIIDLILKYHRAAKYNIRVSIINNPVDSSQHLPANIFSSLGNSKSKRSKIIFATDGTGLSPVNMDDKRATIKTIVSMNP